MIDNRLRVLTTGRPQEPQLVVLAQAGTEMSAGQLAAMLRELADSLAAPLTLVPPVAPIVLDEDAHRVYVDGTEISLTYQEFRLLAYLHRHAGRAVSRDELHSEVWRQPPELITRTVDVHIRRLRVKLGPHARTIETIRQVGYRFAARK